MNTDDLLVLLAVSRQRTFTAAGQSMGVNHTTVARRLAALSKELGGRLLVDGPGGWELTALGHDVIPVAQAVEDALRDLPNRSSSGPSTLRGLVRITAPEVFTVQVLAPAAAAIRLEHPDVRFEIASLTRPTPTYGPAGDLDVGVSRPTSPRLVVERLLDYQLGLFATQEYLARHGQVHSRADLQGHVPVYYIESMLQVVDLDLLNRFFPDSRDSVGATSVLAQLAMVRLGVGVGILPDYLASGYDDLVRLLPADASADLTYWLVSRQDNLRRREVATTATAIIQQARIWQGRQGST